MITLGITILLGGTAAAALYFTKNMGGGDGGDTSIGGECTDVQTMVLKTPSNRLWLRRFIRMDNADGPERVRTALRIAGLLAKKNAVDLIHVSVLDARGPTLRSQMRARSIGAEVLIALKPDKLPDMKLPAMASYYEGPASDEGRYYGEKVVVNIDEIGQIMTAMRSAEEKPDCVSPAKVEDAEAKDKKGGKKEKSEKKETKEEKAAKEKEGGESAETKEKASTDGGETAAAEGEKVGKEQSFLDGMLSMVGLGAGKETTETEPAKDGSEAVAEEPSDAAVEDRGENEAKAKDNDAEQSAEKSDTAADDAKAESDDRKPAARVEDQSATEVDGPAAKEGEEAASALRDAGVKLDATADPAQTEEKPAPPATNDENAEPDKKKSDESARAETPEAD